MKQHTYAFLFFSFLLACTSKEMKKKEHINKKAKVESKKTAEKKLTVLLQPLGDFSKEEAEKFLENFTSNGISVQVANPVALPQSAWYPANKRYRADSLLDFLHRRTSSDMVTIGITHKDISSTKGKIPDWGVMGLGYQPGRACVISTFRIKGKNKQEKIGKVLVHEFGHTRGLPHCPVKDCLMRDAEGKDHLDEEKGFCSNCRSTLKKSGFNIKI